MKLFYQMPNSGWLTRSLTLLTMLLLLTPAVRAQFAVIGGEAITTNGLGSDPVDDFYNFMHYQTIYTAVELSAAGMTPNSEITALGFSVSEDNGPAFPTYTVRMGHTSATNSAAHDASALTNVFGPASYNATATAVGSHDMITLANTFIWDGSSNILVDVCTGNSSMSFGSPYGGVRAENKVN